MVQGEQGSSTKVLLVLGQGGSEAPAFINVTNQIPPLPRVTVPE